MFVQLHWSLDSYSRHSCLPHPGSDRLFTEGRRRLVKSETTAWKPMLSHRAIINWCQDLSRFYQLIRRWPHSKNGCCPAWLRNHDTTTAVLSARQPSRLRNHTGNGHDLNLSVVSSIVFNVGTDKLVCNKRKYILSKSILTILSYI